MIDLARPNSKRQGISIRLMQYFRENPGEELKFSDVAIKFGCTLWTARSAVYRLQALGELESVHVIRAKDKR